MQTFLAALRKDFWLALAMAVGLMSGITSIFREWLSVFHPNATDAGRVFNACLWTCFVISCVFVVARQRSAIMGLEREADRSEAIKNENKRRHEVIADVMREGEALAEELRRGVREYGLWLNRRRLWVDRGSQALAEMGLPTEAAAFRQALEATPDMKGMVSPGYMQTFYEQQLSNCRTKLADIVARRLP